MLLQRKHLAQVARICKPTTATFPPKLSRSNDAVSCERACRQCFYKLLAPILLSTTTAFAKVTTELLTPGDCMLYAYASVSHMQGWPAAMTPAMLVRLSFANDVRPTCTAYGRPPKLRATWG